MMSAWIQKTLFVLMVVCFLMASISPVRANAASQSAISLTDAAGRTVHLDRAPRRIVVVGSAPYIPLHMLYMFPEMRGKLVGYERKVKAEEVFLPLIDPDYQSKVVLESEPGPEQIAALKPDLVVTKGNVPGPLSKSLEVLSIPVMYLGVENPDRFMEDIKITGKALDNEKRSDEILRYYMEKLNLIRGKVSGIKPEDRPRAALLKYNHRGGVTTVQAPAANWIQTAQVQTTGGDAIWLDHIRGNDGWQIVGFEQIAAWNPDKIFMVVWYRQNGPDVIRSLKADDKWRKLKALQANELYLFPEDIYGWDSPDPRWILGMLWMSGHMHPKQFSGIDMKQEIYLFFDQLYGLTKETVDKHIMPRVVLDVAP